MISVALLRTIALVLFGLSILWMIRVIIKGERENLIRTLIFCIIFGSVFLFLQQTETEEISLTSIKNQIRDKFFPGRTPRYVYEKLEGTRGGRRFVSYIFVSPGPKLSLVLDKSQKYFHISDISPVNRVLEYLGLQKIQSAVPELASLTGSRQDLNRYRWDDYPGGILTIDRGICQDRDSLESYHCILTITITRR